MRGRGGLLERMALHRAEGRAWALYDWANSAMVVVVITAVYPVFFSTVACAEPGLSEQMRGDLATQRHSLATTVSMILVALSSPLLGAVADYAGNKKRLLATFLLLGLGATTGLFFVGHGDWKLAMVLFGLANIGASGSFVFYDALLPSVAQDDELDRLSTAGYALGYLGGGILLAGALYMILDPATFGLPHGEGLSPEEATLPTRLSFLAVTVWWAVFSIPLFLRVEEPPRKLLAGESGDERPLRAALGRLRDTFHELRRYRQAMYLLLAFLAYNDGIGTIFRMAAVFGREVGIESDTLIKAILIVQFVGVPCAFLFGALADRIGAKRAIYLGLWVYGGICVLAYRMTTEAEFYALAVGVGLVQGGVQALSRSLFASMIPAEQSGEFFGLFAILEKFAGILGPLVFLLIKLMGGESRVAILAVIGFFVVGGLLLRRVDVDEGQAVIRRARAAARE